jgi:hypothetical protein
MQSLPTLCFRDRSWSEVSLSLLDDDADYLDIDEHLAANGYKRVDMLGSEDGTHVDIWEHEDAGWLAIYSTRESWHPIKIERLQDLIDFTAHIAPSILASVIPSDAIMILHDLCDRSKGRKEMYRLEREEQEKREASEKPQVNVEEQTS